MKITALGNRVEVSGAPALVLRELKTQLTLPNPRYVGAVRAGKTPIGIDKVLRFYEETDKLFVLPAACAGLATRAARRRGVQYAVDADVRTLPPVDLQFRGVLRLYQTAAVADLGRFDHGVLDAPTGSGKTVMGCARIAEVGQPALVLVHTKLLLEQWYKAIEQFLDITPGIIGGGITRGMHSPVIIAVINSATKRIEQLPERTGHVLVDECHRVVASRYWSTLQKFNCRYRTGLSATPYRRDGLGDAIIWALGRIVKVRRAPLVASGAVLPASVTQRATHFTTRLDASEHYQAVIAELVADPGRNGRIAQTAVVAGGVVTLVLSDRTDHCEELARRIPGAVVLHGQLGAVARRKAMAKLKRKPIMIFATTQLIGEGFDLPAADVLLLATPIKFSGRLIQAIGRVLRPADGKSEGRIIDFCDWSVPVLAAGARARAKVYRELTQEEERHE